MIFEADTRVGRWFGQILIGVIFASVAPVVGDSVQSISQIYHQQIRLMEWFFTLAFTLETLARLSCVRHPLRYALSFQGLVDLLDWLMPEVGAPGRCPPAHRLKSRENTGAFHTKDLP